MIKVNERMTNRPQLFIADILGQTREGLWKVEIYDSTKDKSFFGLCHSNLHSSPIGEGEAEALQRACTSARLKQQYEKRRINGAHKKAKEILLTGASNRLLREIKDINEMAFAVGCHHISFRFVGVRIKAIDVVRQVAIKDTLPDDCLVKTESGNVIDTTHPLVQSLLKKHEDKNKYSNLMNEFNRYASTSQTSTIVNCGRFYYYQHGIAIEFDEAKHVFYDTKEYLIVRKVLLKLIKTLIALYYCRKQR